jgi:hypothetical protein
VIVFSGEGEKGGGVLLLLLLLLLGGGEEVGVQMGGGGIKMGEQQVVWSGVSQVYSVSPLWAH